MLTTQVHDYIVVLTGVLKLTVAQPHTVLEVWRILLIVISTIFWLTGVALWIAVAIVVSNPPNGSKWNFSCSSNLP